MVKLILYLFLVLLITIKVKSDEFVVVPNYFKPIEGNAEIDFVYEFDSSPIEIIHKEGNEYIIITKDDEDYGIYLYNDVSRKFVKKMEFELEGFYLSKSSIKNSVLTFYTSHKCVEKYSNSDYSGYYIRKNSIDLNSFKDLEFLVEYSSLHESYFKRKPNRFFDGFDTTKVVFEALPPDNKFNQFEDIEYEWLSLKTIQNKKVYSCIVYNSENYHLYLHRAIYKDGKFESMLSYIMIDSIDVSSKYIPSGIRDITLYQDTDSNLNTRVWYRYYDYEKKIPRFKLAYINEKGDVKVINQDTKNKILTDRSRNIHGFYFTDNNQLYSHIINDDEELDALLYTEKNEFKQRKLTTEEKKLFIQDDDFGSNINHIQDYKDNYIVFSEQAYNNFTFHEYTFGYILVYSIKKDMSEINWVKFIPDRYLENINTVLRDISINYLIEPEYSGNELKFIYSQGGIKPRITKMTLNIDNGEIIEEVDLFENDYTISYLPPFQYHIKDNVYFGLLSIEDDYFVRYRILK